MASLEYWCHFGVKKQKSTLAAYGIANIVPHKKNNA